MLVQLLCVEHDLREFRPRKARNLADNFRSYHARIHPDGTLAGNWSGGVNYPGGPPYEGISTYKSDVPSLSSPEAVIDIAAPQT